MEHLIPYVPVALILAVAIGFALVNLVLGRYAGTAIGALYDILAGRTKGADAWSRVRESLLRPSDPIKELPYESGMLPFGEANVRVPIKFYMVAIIFLLFDVEAVFLLGWAVIFNGTDLGPAAAGISPAAFRAYAFVAMLVFLAVLELGHVYVWRKGGLEWS